MCKWCLPWYWWDGAHAVVVQGYTTTTFCSICSLSCIRPSWKTAMQPKKPYFTCFHATGMFMHAHNSNFATDVPIMDAATSQPTMLHHDNIASHAPHKQRFTTEQHLHHAAFSLFMASFGPAHAVACPKALELTAKPQQLNNEMHFTSVLMTVTTCNP